MQGKEYTMRAGVTSVQRRLFFDIIKRLTVSPPPVPAEFCRRLPAAPSSDSAAQSGHLSPP